MGTTYLTDGDDLTSVANAIRAKSGGSSQLAFPAGFVSEIGNIQSGGKTLLASYTVSEPVSAIQIDYTSAMDGYDLYLMEIEGTASSNTMYICPQVNTTTSLSYNGNAASFHRFYWVVPSYSNTYPPTVNGHMVVIGKTSDTVAANSYSGLSAISFFYIRSYYGNVTFSAGTVMKIWGVKQ